MAIQDVASDEQVFYRDRTNRPKAYLLMAAGAFAICLAVLGFMIASRSPTFRPSLISFSTAPVLIGLGLITAGWCIFLFEPRLVTVDRDGFSLKAPRGKRRFRWVDIGGGSLSGKAGTEQHRALIVTGVDGKPMVSLDDSFHPFEQMVKSMTGHIESRAPAAVDRFASENAPR